MDGLSDVKTGLDFTGDHPFKGNTVCFLSSLAVLCQNFVLVFLEILEGCPGDLLKLTI